MDRALLEILRSPVTGAPLAVEDDALVDDRGERWPIVDGIPVLLADEQRRQRGRGEIVTAAAERSASYYADNYALAGNPERLARRALVLRLLGELADRDAVVLEAGAGPATLAEEISPRVGRYVALDLSVDNLRAGRHRAGDVAAVAGDLTELPFADESFDCCLAIGCLEYVDEPGRAVAELLRVARPGGHVLATFANARSPRRLWDDRLLRRVRTYDRYLQRREEAEAFFTGAGAEIVAVHPITQGLFGYPFSEIGPLRRVPTPPSLAAELVIVARRQ